MLEAPRITAPSPWALDTSRLAGTLLRCWRACYLIAGGLRGGLAILAVAVPPFRSLWRWAHPRQDPRRQDGQLHPLPYPDPNRLVLLWERDVLAEGGGQNIVSMPSFLDWQNQSRSFEGMAAGRGNQFNLGADRGFAPERIEGAIVSWTLLPVLGVQPLIGRNFRSEEDQQGAARVTNSLLTAGGKSHHSGPQMNTSRCS